MGYGQSGQSGDMEELGPCAFEPDPEIIEVGNVHSVIGKTGGFTQFATDTSEMKKSIKLAQVLQRELKGRVISKVAAEIGLGVSLLHDWHSAARAPSARNMDKARKLANYLGLTLEELLFDERTDREVISSTSFTDRGIQYRVNIEKIKRGDSE